MVLPSTITPSSSKAARRLTTVMRDEPVISGTSCGCGPSVLDQAEHVAWLGGMSTSLSSYTVGQTAR